MFATVVSMFKNKEIRNRILYTLAMLFVFRFVAAIIVPGVDTSQLMKGVNTGSFLDMINLLGGGCLLYTSLLLAIRVEDTNVHTVLLTSKEIKTEFLQR